PPTVLYPLSLHDALPIFNLVEIEKTLLRKVGEAVHRFRMIRDGDRVAVALSGGKDSLTMLEALILLSKRAPIDFSVCAFTVEQGDRKSTRLNSSHRTISY